MNAAPSSPAVTEANLDESLRTVWPGLHAYVTAMLGPHRHLTDDVLQETALWIWENRAELPRVTNFTGWAFRAAYFKTLACRRDLTRERAALVSESVLELIAAEVAESPADTEARLTALGSCIADLGADDRRLLEARYRENRPLDAVAAALRQSVNSVHQRLWRLRRALRRCVESKLPAPAGVPAPTR